VTLGKVSGLDRKSAKNASAVSVLVTYAIGAFTGISVSEPSSRPLASRAQAMPNRTTCTVEATGHGREVVVAITKGKLDFEFLEGAFDERRGEVIF
jgi:hypothetical protein